MKVLICDPVDDKALAKMKDAGLDVTVKTGMSPEELLETAPGFDAMVVRSATKVRKPVIEKSKGSLKVIVRGGVGIDNIDHEYAQSLGIEVRNTPSASSASVAELALAHIFAQLRYISRGTCGMKQAKWEKKQLKGQEIAGKTLAVIGLGRIGTELAKKSAALGMKVKGFKRSKIDKPPVEGMEIYYDLDEAIKDADIVSLHLPCTEQTKNIFNKETLMKLKKGCILINCARGGIVDEQALAEVIKEGHISGAGFDVYADEPVKEDNPLLKLDNITLTPHIGASTKEAQARVGQEVADILIEYSKNL
ncbi:MAG: hypothetical protein APR63_09810 [Desulfuromonas sp. SDB]|nr:MAG: hypothetical protein APR63_09810 [Desulfuromonas sp. SDB]